MTELILHIGDGKCGSSSIQKALFNSKHELKINKTLYISDRKSSSYNYSIFFGGHTRGNLVAEQAAARNNLEKIADELKANKYKYLIISCEFLFKYPPNDIMNMLSDFGIDVSGVHLAAFIRDPIGRFESALQQHVKGDHNYPNPLKFSHDFSRPLLKWAASKYIYSLNICSLDNLNLLKRSVVITFFDTLKRINATINIAPEDVRTNESLSAEQVITLQEFRAAYCFDTPRQMRPESDRVISFFQCLNQNFGRVGSPVRVTDDVRGILDRRHQGAIRRTRSIAPWVFHDYRPVSDPICDFDYSSRPLRTILKGWDPERLELLQSVANSLMGSQKIDANYTAKTLGLDTVKFEQCLQKVI